MAALHRLSHFTATPPTVIAVGITGIRELCCEVSLSFRIYYIYHTLIRTCISHEMHKLEGLQWSSADPLTGQTAAPLCSSSNSVVIVTVEQTHKQISLLSYR